MEYKIRVIQGAHSSGSRQPECDRGLRRRIGCSGSLSLKQKNPRTKRLPGPASYILFGIAQSFADACRDENLKERLVTATR